MFIRMKVIKGKPYAYRVKNKWTGRGSRQKVAGYLGRVHELKRHRDTDFNEHSSGTDKLPARDVIRRLIGWVLADHGFRRDAHEWKCGELRVNPMKGTVRNKKSKAVLHVNGDYMCDYSLRKLLNFRSGKEQRDVAMDFAKAFVRAGIPVPQDVFIQLFGKVYKKGQSYV